MKVANGSLVADLFHFDIDDFPFKIPFTTRFNIVVFPLWRRDAVLELEIASIFGAFCVFCFYVATQCLQVILEWLRQGCLQLQLQTSY